MPLIKLNAQSATALDATKLTGNLPAISGASLTGVGGTHVKIAEADYSSGVSTVDFGTLSTDYTDFKVIISGMSADTDNQDFQMLVKKVGDSSFETASLWDGKPDYETAFGWGH